MMKKIAGVFVAGLLLSFSSSVFSSGVNDSPVLKLLSKSELTNLQFEKSLSKFDDKNIGRVQIVSGFEWEYKNKTGIIILGGHYSKVFHDCQLFKLQGKELELIGASAHCKWVEAPRLVWSGDSAWIDLPAIIRACSDCPPVGAGMSLNFDSKKENICTIGIEGASPDMACNSFDPPVSR
jgi:hypothetical protein